MERDERIRALSPQQLFLWKNSPSGFKGFWGLRVQGVSNVKVMCKQCASQCNREFQVGPDNLQAI
eukprot:scaffold321384_cov14-Prasinocladus_malaysianus.AAC.1